MLPFTYENFHECTSIATHIGDYTMAWCTCNFYSLPKYKWGNLCSGGTYDDVFKNSPVPVIGQKFIILHLASII